MKKGEEDYFAQLDDAYRRWNEIATNGCSDPFWADGVNLNLVRNHILYYRRQIGEMNVQMSFLDGCDDKRKIPDAVPNNLMIRGGKWESRAERIEMMQGKLVWADSGSLCIDMKG